VTEAGRDRLQHPERVIRVDRVVIGGLQEVETIEQRVQNRVEYHRVRLSPSTRRRQVAR